MLYSTVNPGTGVTEGNVNGAAQVFAGGVSTGARGNMITDTVFPGPHNPVPAVPAGIVPQAAAETYRAVMVWHPGVVGTAGVEE